MAEFKDELIKVTVEKETESGVTLKCVIEKTLFMSMFGGYDFKRTVEDAIAKRLVNELPIEMLNDIRGRIDLNSVAKIATIEMARTSAMGAR